ncbi:MAG: AbiV family abortive infection protein [Nitrososphaerota archaeon]|jgi:AbiV family abortive infection protein|nr:AbiV family abortive infection protein [Nitrososphaerota archaeon]
MRKADPNADYATIAWLAYQNSLDLHAEAKLLLERRSPRAFTLAVASVEESMKAMLADAITKGEARPEELLVGDDRGRWGFLTHHGGKQTLFALHLLAQAARKRGQESLFQLVETLRTSGDLESVELDEKNAIMEQVTSMERNRQDSVYVGVTGRGDAVKSPKKVITTEMCETLIGQLADFFPILKANLKLTGEEYRTAQETKLEAMHKAQVR